MLAINSRRLRLVGHVARMVDGRSVYQVLVMKLERKSPLEDPGLDGSIILSWIFMNCDVGLWTVSSWFRIGTGGGHL